MRRGFYRKTRRERQREDVRKIRRTRIVVETDRTLAVGGRRVGGAAWCEGCAAEVEMLSLLDAAALARTSAQTVCAWAGAGEVHTRATTEGVLLICPASLFRRCQAG